jgi:hypothetical protein
MRIAMKSISFIVTALFVSHSFAVDMSYIKDEFSTAEDHIMTKTGAFIAQDGFDNFAVIDQAGARTGNFSSIDQVGSGNNAIAFQRGEANYISIQQFGNNNDAVARQTGDMNSIKLQQNQNFNEFTGVQQGNNNLFNVVQNGGSNVNLQTIGNSNTITADMPAGVNYQINVTGDNVKASSVGR